MWRKIVELISEKLEKVQVVECCWYWVVFWVYEQVCESDVKIDEFEVICVVVEKFVCCKGCYYSEQNY